MNIKVGLSKTVNIGNFENIKPSVEVEDSPKFIFRDANGLQTEDIETIEECYERLSELCNRLLNIEVEQITSSLKGLEHKEKDEWVNKYNKIMHKGA